MSTSFRTYRAIKRSLMQALRARGQSHQEQHINTLALLICGIVGAQHVQFAKVIEHAPFRRRKNESMVTRLRRWVQHEDVTPEWLYLPFAKAVLASLSSATLTLILDGSAIGRGCVVLMASVVYHRRAIPIAWVVVRGKKGHLPQDTHCALVQQLQTLVPTDAVVTVLGDGEFDGTTLQATIRAAHWHYVCRTATNILVTARDTHFHIGDLPLQAGCSVAVTDAYVTEAAYGPVTVIGWWENGYKEPLYLLTAWNDADAAIERYRLRFLIETLFSDHKSRGFQVHKSHLTEPARIARLLIGTSLAYLWLVGVGVFAHQQGWIAQFHRADRCDLSLFQVGCRAISYALREGLHFPVTFLPPPRFEQMSVR
jgi:hypothetical protein